ncbi:MAG: hypothetical protein O8C67_10875 [Candidatus Methanoperedens sp.]|nr:hypothetical protein [Candidatus Methanoperedens sp.]
MARISPVKYLVGITNINNTLLGIGSIRTGGIRNTFVGVNAGLVNTANNNTFVGFEAGMSNTSGHFNVFIGRQAGESNIFGTSNIFIGDFAGNVNISGSTNVYIGDSAGEFAEGNSNVFIGNQAGLNELGNNLLYIANSGTNIPLIGGNFSTPGVTINGPPRPNSTFNVAGSQSRAIEYVITSTTLDITQFHVMAATISGDITITLPDATIISGRTYYIQKAVPENNVVVATTSGQFINNDLSTSINSQYETLRVMSDGFDWINQLFNNLDPSLITTFVSMALGQPNNMVNVDSTSGNVTITLPDPSTLQIGHEFVIKNIATSPNIVIVDPVATTIDGFTTPRLLSDLEQSLTLRTDGVRYFIKDEYQNFTVGQLKPDIIPRYTMPGWTIQGVSTNFTLINNTIYYVPFFVASTTFFTEVVLPLFSSGSNGNLATLKIYSFNDGIPGRLVYNIGDIATDTSVTINPYKTKSISVFLNRGFYFMAITNNNIVAKPVFRTVDLSLPYAPPTAGFIDAQSIDTANFMNIITTIVATPFTDPATAPTGKENHILVFKLREN